MGKQQEINWTDVYKKESGRLLSICRRYVIDIQIAEDILHESFIKAIETVDRFDKKGAFEAWLTRITVNTALDYLRKNKKQVFIDIEDECIMHETEMPSDLAGNSKSDFINASFSSTELLEVIDALPIQHKTIFNLYVIDGFSHKEISNSLSITENQSKTTLHRSRKKIQTLLLKKANEKKAEKQKRRLALGIFGLISGTEMNAMDKVFQKTFSRNNVNAKQPDGSFAQNLSQAQPILIKSSIGIAKVALVSISAASIIAFVTVGLTTNRPTSDKSSKPEIATPRNIKYQEERPNTNTQDTIPDTRITANANTTITNATSSSLRRKEEQKFGANSIKKIESHSELKQNEDSIKKLAINNDSRDTTSKNNPTIIKKQVILKKKVYIQ